MAPPERMSSANRSFTGRPAKDRAALATAFMAKALLNLPTTRDLMVRLRVDSALRRLRGWYNPDAAAYQSSLHCATRHGEWCPIPLDSRLEQLGQQNGTLQALTSLAAVFVPKLSFF